MTLLVAGTPTNLKFADGVKAEVVESDVYQICERLKKEHPRVFVIRIARDGEQRYIVNERDLEGTDWTLFSVDELDQRVIDKLDRIVKIPFEVRLKMAEKDELESKIAMEEEASDKFYENFGDPMRRQLLKDGFGSGTVTTSYPKRGPKDRDRSK